MNALDAFQFFILWESVINFWKPGRPKHNGSRWNLACLLWAQRKTPCRLMTSHREKRIFRDTILDSGSHWPAIDWSGLPQVPTLMCTPIVTSKVTPMVWTRRSTAHYNIVLENGSNVGKVCWQNGSGIWHVKRSTSLPCCKCTLIGDHELRL